MFSQSNRFPSKVGTIDFFCFVLVFFEHYLQYSRLYKDILQHTSALVLLTTAGSHFIKIELMRRSVK